jgi:hypothetical protein
MSENISDRLQDIDAYLNKYPSIYCDDFPDSCGKLNLQKQKCRSCIVEAMWQEIEAKIEAAEKVTVSKRVGKKKADCILDGQVWNQMPNY